VKQGTTHRPTPHLAHLNLCPFFGCEKNTEGIAVGFASSSSSTPRHCRRRLRRPSNYSSTLLAFATNSQAVSKPEFH